MLKVVKVATRRLAPGQVRAIAGIMKATWGRDDRDLGWYERMVRRSATDPDRGAAYRGRRTAQSYLIWDGTDLVAHALTFGRGIRTSRRTLTVLAVACLCVKADRRGQGIGAQIARAALQRVDDGTFPVAVYQTRVPGFYRRLGARLVRNRFINSRNESDPRARVFWDPCVMVYPKSYPWPRGTVDMQGPGY